MNFRLRSITHGAALALALGSIAACNNAQEDAGAEAPAAEAPAADDSGMAAGATTGEAPMVGGAAMLPTRTIVQNASEASNLTTLV